MNAANRGMDGLAQGMEALRIQKTRLRFKLVCALGLMGSVLLISAAISFWNEPVLAGKGRRVWQKEEAYWKLTSELDRAGTNAIPFLVAAAMAAPPIYESVYTRVWGFWFRKSPVTIRRLLPSPVSAINRREMLRRIAISRLGAFSPDSSAAMTALKSLLRTRDRFAMLTVCETLGKVGGRAEAAVPALLELLNHSNHDLAALIVRTLGKIAPRRPDVVEALTQRLDHTPEVALAAAKVLRSQQLEPDRVVSALAGHLDGDIAVAWEAADLLGQYGPAAASALPGLIEMLQTPDKRLRRKAALTLAKLGPGAAAAGPALRDALQDEEKFVRDAVAAALTKIAGQP